MFQTFPSNTMEFLIELWLPILLASLAVYITGNILYMVLPHHRKDFQPLPDEDALRTAIAAQNLPRAAYAIPHAASKEDWKNKEKQEKFRTGPVGILTIGRPGTSMTRQLIQHVFYVFAVSICVAYVSFAALGGGDLEYLKVFQITGTVSFLAHGSAHFLHSIWFHQPWGTTVRNTIDALVYALLTAGFFGWLW